MRRTLRSRLKRYAKAITGVTACWLASMSIANASLTCNDNGALGPNMIKNVCWSCMFPLRVAGVPLNGSNSGAPSGRDSSPLCFCEGSLGIPTPGVVISMWEPARLIELQRTPGCMSSLGGVRLPFDRKFLGSHGNTEEHRDTQFMHYHYFAYPLFAMLDLFSIMPCSDSYLDFDLMFVSELDPTWNNDTLGAFTYPESAAVANLPAQLACSADAVASTAGNPIDKMFWCAGSWGSMYPFTGNTQTHNTLENASLLSARALATLHRRGLAKQTMGSSAVCKPHTAPMIPKSQYKFSTFYYNPETSRSHAFGESPLRWGAGRVVPQKEDPTFMIWRWKDCCRNI